MCEIRQVRAVRLDDDGSYPDDAEVQLTAHAWVDEIPCGVSPPLVLTDVEMTVTFL